MIEWKRLPDNETLLRFTTKVADLHREHSPGRDNVDDAPFVGWLCQRKLAYLTGGDLDMRLLGGKGDGGVDQWLLMKDGEKYPADGKGARKPYELICSVESMKKVIKPEGRPYKPMIFVLGELVNCGTKENPTDKMLWDVELLKWNWDAVLRRSKPKIHDAKRNILNYWVKADECRPMEELLAKVQRNWGRGA